MATSDSEPAGYIAFRWSEVPDLPVGYISSPLLEDVEAWLAQPVAGPPATQPIDPTEPIEPPDPTRGAEILGLMQRFRSTIGEYYSLNVLSTLLLPMLKSKMLQDGAIGLARSSFTKIHDENGKAIYAYSEADRGRLNAQLRRLTEMTAGHAAVPNAVLLSLAATFDSHVADVVRTLLKTREEKFKVSDRKISVSDIFEMRDFSDVIDRLIEDEIDSLMRGSHDEQVRYIEKNFNIDIVSKYERYSDFLEIFERRNVVAHGNGTANRLYVKNCAKFGVNLGETQIGTALNLSGPYLGRATDILLEFGLKLMFVLWRKNYKVTDDEAGGTISEIAYDLIKTGHPNVATWLLKFALTEQRLDVPDRTKKMMIINLANALRKTNKCTECEDLLKDTDWSAASDDFQICVASLKMDVDKVVTLMPVVAKSGTVKKQYFREWPVFDWVRDDPRFLEAFAAHFGEPLGAEDGDGALSSATDLQELATLGDGEPMIERAALPAPASEESP